MRWHDNWRGTEDLSIPGYAASRHGEMTSGLALPEAWPKLTLNYATSRSSDSSANLPVRPDHVSTIVGLQTFHFQLSRREEKERDTWSWYSSHSRCGVVC